MLDSKAMVAGVAALALSVGAVEAATLETDGSTVTAVKGVSILGTRYNITWLLGTAQEVYGGDFSPLTNVNEAQAVLDELNDLFNGPGVVGISGPDFDSVRADNGVDYSEYYLAYTIGNDGKANYASTLVKPQVGWDTERDADDIGVGTVPPVPFAKVTVVPVPAAVWLFGSGVVVLGAVARRRRLAAA